MRKELRKLGRQLFVNPDNHDIRNNYFRKKKMFQKMVKHKKREIKQMIIDKLELLEENDPQRYWNLVDQLKNSENDSQINSVLTLDQWTNHYKELLVNPNHQNLNGTINSRIMKLKSQQIFNELSVGVKVSEVLMAVKSLKRGKAVGPDSVNAEMVKTTAEIYPECFQKCVIIYYSRENIQNVGDRV